jgi:hypothetical protein
VVRCSLEEFEFCGRRRGGRLGELSKGNGGLTISNSPSPISPIGSMGDLFVSSFTTNSVLRFNRVTGAFLGVFVAVLCKNCIRPAPLRF